MSIQILTLPVGQMQSNCYLVMDKKTSETIIIDPGDDGEFIIQKIQDSGAKPIMAIATHGHFDHIMAATEVTLAFGIPFLMHKWDEVILKRHESTAKYFLGIPVDPPPTVYKYIKDGDTVSFGEEQLKVIETPGHTPGSICLLYKKGKDTIVFTGDTIFAHGGIGRTDLHGGDKKILINSIYKKLFTLAGDTIMYPGHGESTTIEDEKHNLSQMI